MLTFLAVLFAATFILVFLTDLIIKGYPALQQAEMKTTISYSAEAIKNPERAFPEDTRHLISKSRTRSIPHEIQYPVIELPISYSEQAQTNPKQAIQTFKISGEHLPPYLRQQAPITIPQNHLLKLVGEEGLQTLRKKLKQGPSSVKNDVNLKGSRALQALMNPDKNSPLPEELKETVNWLEKAGRLRMVFNEEQYEGTQRTEWVLLKAEYDQYLKDKHSKVGFQSRAYEFAVRKAGRKPESNPSLQTILSEIKGKKLKPGARGSEQVVTFNSTTKLKEFRTAWNRTSQLDQLHQNSTVQLTFNDGFFVRGNSRLPEAAGMKGAIIGSVYLLILVFVTSIPVGVLTAIYLEEFAPDNWITQLIEVNINNLAAIPSILYGLLGLAIFINTFGAGRSTVIAGGLTLALRTLPIVIISTRSALRSVQDSIRMAGHSMGATRWQVVLHHVLPQALPGILTGSIIGLAQAMGETAPLIIIGMVGFFPQAPSSFADKSTVMPAQIYGWFSMPERAFESRAALAILVLLAVLFLMNGLAVYIRSQSENSGPS